MLSRSAHKQQLKLSCNTLNVTLLTKSLFCDTLQLCQHHFVVLQAVMGAGSEDYSEYTAFHLFEEYLEVHKLRWYVYIYSVCIFS